MSPTQRTLQYLREQGYLCAITERWQGTKTGGVRVDLFGFVDILAINDSHTIAVQTTSHGGHSARRNKILGLYTAKKWLEDPSRKILIISWGKRAGSKAFVERIEWISNENFKDNTLQHTI